MNPSSIKKIINIKVTIITFKGHLPMENPCLPIYISLHLHFELFLTQTKKIYDET